MSAPTNPGGGLPAFYTRHYRDGMTDLSRNSPEPLPLALPPTDTLALDAVRPPAGSPELRAAIARLYRTLTPDDVLVCSGASEALVALALALGRPDADAICAPGAYPSVTVAAERSGGVREDFAGAPDVSFAVAANGTVPDGRRLDVRDFIARATGLGAIPVVDEVHRHIVLDDGEAPDAAADIDPRAISIGDLSKPLGLGGLRVGWVATRHRAARVQIERWLQLITGGPSVYSEAAALVAVRSFERRVAVHVDDARRNAPDVYEALERAGWSFTPAELGLTVVARPPAPLAPDALDVTERAGLFLVPCSAITGADDDGALRISVLADPVALRAALALLASDALGARRPHREPPRAAPFARHYR